MNDNYSQLLIDDEVKVTYYISTHRMSWWCWQAECCSCSCRC